MTGSNHDLASTNLAAFGDPSGDVAVALADAVAAAPGHAAGGHGPFAVGHQRAGAVVAEPAGTLVP